MSSLGSLEPDHGGRLQLTRRHADEAHVAYDCELRALGVRAVGRAVVQVGDGQVDLLDLAAAPPWLQQYVIACLRQAWRQHSELGWPRRLTRWRQAPKRSSAAPSLEQDAQPHE